MCEVNIVSVDETGLLEKPMDTDMLTNLYPSLPPSIELGWNRHLHR